MQLFLYLQCSKTCCGLSIITFLLSICMLLQIIRVVLLGILIHEGSKSISKSNFTRSKVDYMLNILSQIVYCFEYIPLIYGIWTFRCYISTENRRVPNVFCKTLYKYCSVFFLFIHFLLSMLSPVLLVSIREDVYGLFYNVSNNHIVNTYVSLPPFVDHIYNFFCQDSLSICNITCNGHMEKFSEGYPNFSEQNKI